MLSDNLFCLIFACACFTASLLGFASALNTKSSQIPYMKLIRSVWFALYGGWYTVCALNGSNTAELAFLIPACILCIPWFFTAEKRFDKIVAAICFLCGCGTVLTVIL